MKVIFAIAALFCIAAAQTLTFDDVSVPAQPLPTTVYGAFSLINAEIANSTYFAGNTTNGFANAAASGTNFVAPQNISLPTTIKRTDNSTFNATSVVLTALNNQTTLFNVTGSFNGTIYTVSILYLNSTNTYTQVLNFADIDTLSFISNDTTNALLWDNLVVSTRSTATTTTTTTSATETTATASTTTSAVSTTPTGTVSTSATVSVTTSSTSTTGTAAAFKVGYVAVASAIVFLMF
ncbi:hypothetical protein PROFUN_01812 [Planoprotostelium fungivorum]|uniref:Uncharacterized protein n=1 Tax=Planoprotostelium fungivorum TaxID=1890364 RepID=A0A2P6NYS6_9EUKA|nr:hypothetical protein PROFUN_01812 [Planoprotostelium fungivorum]